MDRVRLEPGRIFRSGQTELSYDLYAPAEAGAARAAVVFISGAEQVRDWKWFQDYGRLAAAHGLVGVIPDKRYPRGFEGTRSGYDDTEAVVAHLIDNSEALGIDPKRICLWTFSAGGRISAIPFRASATGIRCLVAYYGVMDASGQVPQDVPNRAELVTTYLDEQQQAAREWFESLRDRICAAFEAIEREARTPTPLRSATRPGSARPMDGEPGPAAAAACAGK
jgi:acetyl esterase/lipase